MAARDVKLPEAAKKSVEPTHTFERQLATLVPVPPVALIALRLVLTVPITWVLAGSMPVGQKTPLLVALMGLFLALDYIDGTVARVRGVDGPWLRVADRFADMPVTLMLLWLNRDLLPEPAMGVKIATDLGLLLLYARGLGSNFKRLRATASHTSLLALLMLSLGLAPRLVTSELTTTLLWINAGVSIVIVLRRLKVLSRRRIADALSLGNLACGVMAMVFAQRQEFDISLLLLTLGAALDGMDGAAARRWGGSPYGVYMDDIADGVSYGLAPGFAITCCVPAVEGLVVGGLYSCFVIARLTFFTLNKSQSDPAYFSGVPSPAGGLTAMSTLALFHERPLMVGFLVGIACTLMVAFDVQHRHLGRALASRRMRAYAALLLIVLALSAALSGIDAGVSIVLVTLLVYGFSPSFAAFRRVISQRRVSDNPPAR
jgi:CDP-diacylglycerol--serine O-phosphatidyltransferase